MFRLYLRNRSRNLTGTGSSGRRSTLPADTRAWACPAVREDVKRSNVIFLPHPTLSHLIFFPTAQYYREDDIASPFPSFHVIFFPKAMINSLSLWTTWYSSPADLVNFNILHIQVRSRPQRCSCCLTSRPTLTFTTLAGSATRSTP